MNTEAETMIFFSLHYPFHFTDSYLDEEINLLASKFKKVIVISSNTFSEEKRAVPSNVIVYRFSPVVNLGLRTASLSLLGNPIFYKNIFQLIFKHKIGFSLLAVKELFAFYSRALSIRNFLEQVIEEQQVEKNKLLIYTYWMVESTMAAVLLKKETPSIKVISKAHSQDVYFERSPVKYHPFRKYIFEELNRLFFISDDARKYFIKKHGLTKKEEERISISRIGIDGANENYISQSSEQVLRIISVAYIQKIKRVDLIIDALALIKDVQIEWYHAGHSNQSETEFEELKKYATEKLLPLLNISFSFLGKTAKEELFRLYQEKRFDLFLNVSETEGIPVSMMEAMSYSVPVIGTNVGGVAEIVVDSLNGFLLSPYPDANEVMQAIKQFEKLSVEKKNALRENAFNTWDTKYNGKKNNRQFVQEVELMLGVSE